MWLHRLIRLSFLLLAFICLFRIAPEARAQEFSLGIYPPIVQVDALSPSEITTPITLENLSSDTVTLSVQLRQFIPNSAENGEIVFVKEADGPHKKIFSKVKIKEGTQNRTQVTLSPRQKKNVNLEINLPANEPASDYYFSVLFISNPERNAEENESYSVGGIATNVLLSIGEKGLPQGRITNFNAPYFLTKGPVGFKVRVENQSPFFISTEGNIIIKNVFGQTIGNLEFIPSNILGKSSRFLGNKEGLEQNLDNPRALWNEKFLLGIYTADLTISLSDQGPILRDKITFIAIPLELILGFFLSVIVLIFIYRRVKRKMDSYEEV